MRSISETKLNSPPRGATVWGTTVSQLREPALEEGLDQMISTRATTEKPGLTVKAGPPAPALHCCQLNNSLCVFSHPLTTARAKIPDNILTHTDRRLPGPAVVLLADAHRHPDQTEAGLALIHHTATVVVVLTVDLPVDDGAGNAAVPGCRRDTGEAVRAPAQSRSTPTCLGGSAVINQTGAAAETTDHF